MRLTCFASPAALPRREPLCRTTCSRSPPQMTASKPLPDSASAIAPQKWDLTLSSPCKINLFLRIMGKRPDGFHELASLFQSISLRDTIHFSKKSPHGSPPDQDTLECDKQGVPTNDSNLVLKALAKFRERTGVEQYFHVRLEKRVPFQAGLGGGSANAATALWAANVLADKPCTNKQLAEFGAEFGSDVSFFLSSGTAYCTGRGEVLEDVQPLPQQSLFIIKPNEGLSTAEVFKTLKMEDCSDRDPRQLLDKMRAGVISAEYVNDLEVPSFKLLPRLAELKEKLKDAGFKVVLMSGSGTSFFCLGRPTMPNFLKAFPMQNDVQIFQATFQGRRSQDMWYFEDEGGES